MTILRVLQRSLELFHDVRTELDVAAYVVDAATHQEIPGAQQGRLEQLFVREVDGDLELALYVAPEIMHSLEEDDPHNRLHAGNLENYCVALEGVSHFVLVIHRALVGWPVSALELEIQAEVDKFVGSWLLLAQQGASMEAAAQALAHTMFESYVVWQDVPAEEIDRYHVASRVARQFCRSLAANYSRDGHVRRIQRDVRRFFRKSLAEKLQAA